MGREIRRVPPNWEHPKTQRANHRLGRMEECYKPLHDEDAEAAWAEWQAGFSAWLAGENKRVADEYGETDYPLDQPYRAFCSWDGTPPDPADYRPRWGDDEATWFQVYETVSEGTPVTPPFATREELVDYLATHGDFWDQDRRARGERSILCGPWDRTNAKTFVNAGWAPSMVVTQTAAGVDVKAPRDGI